MMNQFPPCYDTQEQYDGWIELAKETGIENPEVTYCLDCLPELKSYALARGLCSFPKTFFITIVDEDGEEEIIGVNPIE